LIQDVQSNNNQLDIINNSNVVVFNTQYVYEKYKSRIAASVPIKICPLGIDFQFFQPTEERHPDVLPNSVLYIGAATNYPKGFNIMLDIIDKMTDQNFCLIMKDNFSIHQIPESARNRVRIFNKIPSTIVRTIINSCILAICTSYEETQHLSGIECAACNIPIVARAVGVYFDNRDIREWGLIADDSNFIDKLIYVRNNLKEFHPRECFISKYSLEQCKNNWKSIVLKITKEKLNDVSILNELKLSCYDGNDIRACWIANYLLDTDIKEFKNYARWSLQHWNMYKGFLKHITVRPSINILDAACGNGFNTKMLTYELLDSKVYGVDMNKNIIDLAKKYNTHSNIEYSCIDLFNYNPDIKFDYIFFLEILEHIKAENHYIILDKLLGLLSDNGLLFISTPNELDNKDVQSEHIGLMNRERTLAFINKYKDNFVNTEFYDNTKLETEDCIITEPIETYEKTSSGIGGISSAPNKSHFKIVLKRHTKLS
jgi:2-polyprenyl-3-methyl-5-hydroxy-6-metoxy-1,4-benzoquinol methylase